MYDHSTENEVLLPRQAVEEMTGFSRAFIYKLISDPMLEFPRPVRIGAAVRWRQSDVQSWIRAQIVSQASA